MKLNNYRIIFKLILSHLAAPLEDHWGPLVGRDPPVGNPCATGMSATDNGDGKLIYPHLYVSLVIELLDGCRGILQSLTQFVYWLPWLEHAVFSTNWQPGVEILLGKWAVGGVTQTKTKTDILTQKHISNRTTGCSIVFQRNKYVNLACVFSICKEKCWGSSGLFLRSGEWYDGCGVRFIDRCSSWCVSTAVLSAAEIFIWLIHLILCCVCVCSC